MFFSFANKNVREGGGFTVPSDIARSGKNIYLLVYIRLSSIDFRLIIMEKWSEIEQNGLHQRFSHEILIRNG